MTLVNKLDGVKWGDIILLKTKGGLSNAVGWVMKYSDETITLSNINPRNQMS